MISHWSNKENALKKKYTILLSILLAVLVNNISGAGKDTLTLASGGATDYLIVQSKSPSKAEQTAAVELASYLKKVTGAEFKRVRENADGNPPKAIYLGWTEFAKKHGVNLAKLGREEWVIKTIGDNLIITGGRSRGTVYGVFDFLEKMVGVHMLDVFSESIPSKKNLAITELNIKKRPAFKYHRVGDYYKSFAPETSRKFDRFFLFNKSDIGWMRPDFGIDRKWGFPVQSHSFGRYIGVKEYRKTHPEFFAMNNDGKRTIHPKASTDTWFTLCLSNKAVRKIFIRKLREFIKTDRIFAKKNGIAPPFIYSIDDNDCIYQCCQCPNCQAIVKREGAQSGLIIDFINEIADDIKNDYPNILIQTFAYNYSLKAPKKIKPRDNVMIRWCDHYGTSEYPRPITHKSNKQMRDLFTPWSKITKNMAIWDYWRMFVQHTPGFYAPLVNISCLKPDLKYFKDNGVKSFYAENEEFNYSSTVWGDDLQSFNPLRTWLGLKLIENPDSDNEELLNIFFKGYYGKAADKMRAYLAYLEEKQNKYPGKLIKLLREDYYKAHLDLDFFITANKLLDEAEKACGNNYYNKIRVIRERLVVDSALLHLEPALKRKYCSEGQHFPFNRADVLKRYTDNWNRYIEYFISKSAQPKAKAFVGERITYLKSMPLISRDSIKTTADLVDDKEIKIDGVLNEKAWGKVAAVYLTPYDKLQKLKVKTKVKTLWSKDKLFISFECSDDRVKDMEYEKNKNSAKDLWKYSSVEIYINPTGDRKNYYQIIISPSGAIENYAVKYMEGENDVDPSWKSKTDSAVKIDPKSWVVELAIPFSSIKYPPRENASLVMNFNRSRHLESDKKASQLQTWTPLLGKRGFRDIEKFGSVKLVSSKNGKQFTSFEDAFTSPTMKTERKCKVLFSKEISSDGACSLKVTFQPQDSYRGVMLKVEQDWSAYKALTADIFLQGNKEITITNRLADNVKLAKGKSYYKQSNLHPGWNKNVKLFSLDTAKNKMDITKVNNYFIYLAHNNKQRVIFIDNLKLVK